MAETEVRGLQRDLEGWRANAWRSNPRAGERVPHLPKDVGDHHERLIATLDDRGKNIESSIMARN